MKSYLAAQVFPTIAERFLLAKKQRFGTKSCQARAGNQGGEFKENANIILIRADES